MRWNILGRRLFGRRSSGRKSSSRRSTKLAVQPGRDDARSSSPRSSSRRSLGRQSSAGDKYLIEFRFHGHAKRTLKELREAIAKNFNARIGERKEVPHITIVGPCRTDDRKKLIREVENVAKKYDLVGFRLGGFDYFPGRAIYADILPSKELVEMRQNLVKKLGKFCQLTEHDHKPKFSAHSTLCLNTHFSGRTSNNIERTFDKILEFLSSWKMPEMDSYVLRVTVLGGNSKIVCEYDLMLKRMLSRREALDRDTFKKTIDAFRKRQAKIGLNRPNRPEPVNEDDYSGRVFVISDLHFDHKNIIRFCNRPFRTTREMNHALMENWNRVVGDDDRVYYLGDMAYGRQKRPIDFWLSKLNGEIRFIRGNHDTDIITRAEVIKDKFPIRYRGREFLLMHDPYRPSWWDGWIIHGDKHNNDLARYPHVHHKNKTINVCAELTKYTPISLDEIISKISRCNARELPV